MQLIFTILILFRILAKKTPESMYEGASTKYKKTSRIILYWPEPRNHKFNFLANFIHEDNNKRDLKVKG